MPLVNIAHPVIRFLLIRDPLFVPMTAQCFPRLMKLPRIEIKVCLRTPRVRGFPRTEHQWEAAAHSSCLNRQVTAF